jgi:hypothetical protein
MQGHLAGRIGRAVRDPGPGAQDKGATSAATQVSGLELGGLFGSLTSGAVSDHLVRSNDGSKGNVGLRVQARPPRRACPAVVVDMVAGTGRAG